uniref:synaptotagmin-like protein 4 isoform X2 n=1 Tax=Myxine glutinosa TaxID=7769 RepID=UPI00358F70D9
MDLDLSFLSEAEKRTILGVIQRNEELQNSEATRLKKLRRELNQVKRKGARHGDKSANDKSCARCQASLGFLFNTGQQCPGCNHMVCTNCQVPTNDAATSDANRRQGLSTTQPWWCIVCSKEMKIKAETGDWFRELCKKRFGGDPLGVEVVRRSIRHRSGMEHRRGSKESETSNRSAGSMQELPDSPRSARSVQLMRIPEEPKEPEENWDAMSMPTIHSHRSHRSDKSRATSGTSRHIDRRKASAITPAPNKATLASIAETQSPHNVPVKESPTSSSSTTSLHLEPSPDHQRNTAEVAMNDDHLKRPSPVKALGGLRVAINAHRFIRNVRKRHSSPEEVTAVVSGTSTEHLESSQPFALPAPVTVSSHVENADDSLKTRKEKASSEDEVQAGDLRRPTSPSLNSESGSMYSEIDRLDRYLDESAREPDDGDDASIASALKHYPRSSTAFGKRREHAPLAIPEIVVNSKEECFKNGVDDNSISEQSSRGSRAQSELDLRSVGNGMSLRSVSVPDLVKRSDGGEDSESDIDQLVSQHQGRTMSQLSGSKLKSRTMLSTASLLSAYSDVDFGNVDVQGDLLCSLLYDYKIGTLCVHIHKCRNLAVANTKVNTSNPYVKTYLLPDKSRASKRKTSIKHATLDPIYNENLKYPISQSQLVTRTLQFSVWHHDRFGRNVFLGEAEIDMDTWNLENRTKHWLALRPKIKMPTDAFPQYKGELLLGLKYVPPEDVKEKSVQVKEKTSWYKRPKNVGPEMKVPSTTGELYVQVKEARNLTAAKAGRTADPFVKGYLLDGKTKSEKMKTPVVSKEVNPVWNFTLVYPNVTPELLAKRCLELTVWDHETIVSNHFLGGLRLSVGTEGEAPKEPWLDSNEEEANVWNQMLDHQNTWVEGTFFLRHTMGGSKN